MATQSLNYGLRVVNRSLPMPPGFPATIGGMKVETLADRLRETFGNDTGGAVARKLALHGASVSYQAVHKWLNGGNVSDENLAAVAAAYGVSLAWLKYGEGDKRAPIAEVMEALPPESQQQVLDFIEFQLNRPGLPLTPQSVARYLAMIDRIKQDMDTKKARRR